MTTSSGGPSESVGEPQPPCRLRRPAKENLLKTPYIQTPQPPPPKRERRKPTKMSFACSPTASASRRIHKDGSANGLDSAPSSASRRLGWCPRLQRTNLGPAGGRSRPDAGDAP